MNKIKQNGSFTYDKKYNLLMNFSVLIQSNFSCNWGANVSEREYFNDKWALLTMKQVLIWRTEPCMQV